MPEQMQVVSLNVGRARHLEWQGMEVETSIFKSSVDGPLRVHTLGISGDEQSDLTVHGGVNKAVYVYPAIHYSYWKRELPDLMFPWGAFGENLTVDGVTERDVYVGDRLSIGTAEFIVTQPRMPCFKLGVRFDRPDMTKRFFHSGLSGFYLSVAHEGAVQAGDTVTITPAPHRGPSISDIFRGKPGDRYA